MAASRRKAVPPDEIATPPRGEELEWQVPRETAPGILQRFPPEAETQTEIQLREEPSGSTVDTEPLTEAGGPPSRWHRPKRDRAAPRDPEEPRSTVKMRRDRMPYGGPRPTTKPSSEEKAQPFALFGAASLPKKAPGADEEAIRAALARGETMTLAGLRKQPSAHWIPPRGRRDKHYWVHVQTTMQRERTRRIHRGELEKHRQRARGELRSEWIPAGPRAREATHRKLPQRRSRKSTLELKLKNEETTRSNVVVPVPVVPRPRTPEQSLGARPPAAYKIYHFAYLRYEVLRSPLPRPAAESDAPRARSGSLARFLDARLPPASPLRRSLERRSPRLPLAAVEGVAAGAFGMRWLIEQAWNELGLTALVDRWLGSAAGWDRALFALVAVHLIAPRGAESLAGWQGAALFWPEAEALEPRQLAGVRSLLARRWEKLAGDLGALLAGVFPAAKGDAPTLPDGDSSSGEPAELLEVRLDGSLLRVATPSGAPRQTWCAQSFGGRAVHWVRAARSGETRLDPADFAVVLREGELPPRSLRTVLARSGGYRRHPERGELSYKSVRVEGETYLVRRDQNARAAMLRLLDSRVTEIRKVLARGPEAAEELLAQRHLRSFLRRDARRKDDEGEPAGPVILDRMALAAARRFAGLAVAVTKAPVPAAATLADQADAVESVFAQLRQRPQDGGDRAELAIASVAQLLIRWLESRSGLELESLQRAFAGLGVKAVDGQGYATTPLGAEARRVLDRLGYERPPARFRVVGPWRVR